MQSEAITVDRHLFRKFLTFHKNVEEKGKKDKREDYGTVDEPSSE